MKRIAIVGGGISGLAAAYYLAKAGQECTLIEACPRLGGVIRTEHVEGCVVEAGPDSFIAQKPWAMELIRELGIEGQVIGSQDHLRRTYVRMRGRLVPLPEGIQFLMPTRIGPMLTTPLLSWRAKARLGLEWFRRPRRDSPADRSVADFVIDHYGREVNEYLAQPMLAGVYGGAPENLSIHAVMPRMAELERRYGSVTRGVLAGMRRDKTSNAGRPSPSRGAEAGEDNARTASLFLSMKGGMQQLIDALAARLEGKVRRITARVEHVEGTRGAYRLAAGGDSLAADEVVVATPAYRAGELLRSADPDLAALLEAIRYNSSVTVALIYARPEFDHRLDGFGFVVPRAEGCHLTACTWVNTKFPHRAPDSRALLRAFLGAAQAEKVSGDSDEQLAALAHQELSGLMGYSSEPVAWRVHRWPKAMAQYEVGHLKRQQEIDEHLRRCPGLWLTGNGYSGIGIPDCIRRSQFVARAIAQGALASRP
jgi:oxygen-dependent protoporphyrinogen oxidase